MDVRLRNPFGGELCRLNIAIKQGNRQQVGKAMIGVLFGMDVGLRTEASTASEVISILHHISFDAYDVGIKWVHFVQFEDTEDRRFSRDRAVVAF